MMCAIEAGKRGRRVLVIDHAKAAGEKIRISGGGRCNFTNIHTAPDRFISGNPRFAISALSRYTPRDFLALIEAHGIAWHEKTLGQLFCDGSAMQIVSLLKNEMARVGAALQLNTRVRQVEKTEQGFRLTLDGGDLTCDSLIIASGGKSIPKMGATGFGYDIATQFNIPLVTPRPGLVPFTLDQKTLERLASLSGVSVETRVSRGKTSFDEAMLFTHRGLSGPSILQLSSYWRDGEEIEIDMARGVDIYEALRRTRGENGKQAITNALPLPKRLSQLIAEKTDAPPNIADASDAKLREIASAVNAWRIIPNGTEGYRTAEVTVGGVDTNALDQRTMQARAVPGLYFIGEVVDVTGWLGGYNFQWAWASGWSAGQAV